MRESRFLSPAIAVMMLFLSGCFGGRDALGTITEITAPAQGESGQPNFAVGPTGRVYLSWNEVNNAGEKSVRFALKTPEGWSEPGSIVSSDTLLFNWADFPSLIELPGDILAAHWLSAMPGSEGYGVRIAISKDQGKTWSSPVTPHRDSSDVEHGFVSLVPDGDGVGVIWLDSRKLRAASDDVSLMYTRIGLDGTLGQESEIDSRACECCQPSSIAVPDGVLAVYRDRTKEEIRDIVITRFDGKEWSAPKTIFDDGWEIFACPIQGPAISAAGNHVAVAWFTGAKEQMKVQVALSPDGGKTFGSPVKVNEAEPVGRVDVVALESGGAVVTWIEHTSRGGEVRARQIDAGGKAREALTVGKTSLGSASGFPRVERTGDSILFAWTDTSEHRIRTAIAGK